ncbi:hypothetical protein BH11MYX3_BH11MYX3_05170 [soil metagenome]
MNHRLSSVAVLALSATSLWACSDDPVSYSAPVGINLKAKSGDTMNGVVSNDKGITTESGNPYGAFITDAKAKLGGKDPSRIEIDKVVLLLGASSSGVTRLGEVFDGPVEVLFQVNDSNNSYPAATSLVPASTGSATEIATTFDSDALPEFDYLKLLGGGFKVVLRGPATAGFSTKGADADLQVTFTFAAFE